MRANKISRDVVNLKNQMEVCHKTIYNLILEETAPKGERKIGLRQQFEIFFKKCTDGKEVTDQLVDTIIAVFVSKHQQYSNEEGIEAIKVWANEIIHPETKKQRKNRNAFRVSPLPSSTKGRKNDGGRD